MQKFIFILHNSWCNGNAAIVVDLLLFLLQSSWRWGERGVFYLDLNGTCICLSGVSADLPPVSLCSASTRWQSNYNLCDPHPSCAALPNCTCHHHFHLPTDKSLPASALRAAFFHKGRIRKINVFANNSFNASIHAVWCLPPSYCMSSTQDRQEVILTRAHNVEIYIEICIEY